MTNLILWIYGMSTLKVASQVFAFIFGTVGFVLGLYILMVFNDYFSEENEELIEKLTNWVKKIAILFIVTTIVAIITPSKEHVVSFYIVNKVDTYNMENVDEEVSIERTLNTINNLFNKINEEMEKN